MRFHVKCPRNCKKIYSFNTLVECRAFVCKMMVKLHCEKQIRIYEGKQYYGFMKMVGGVPYYKRAGSTSKPARVNPDGTTE